VRGSTVGRPVLGYHRRTESARAVAGSTAKRRHSPGIPFNSCGPRSSKPNPEPATRSLTVLETRTSLGPASAATRAPVWTAIPAMVPSTSSHSPVWSPARISIPRSRTHSTTAQAQRIARAGPSKLATKPSPVVFTSLPRKRVSCRRTAASCEASSSRQARSPSAAARSLEPTMSVKSTVARTRSGSGSSQPPAPHTSCKKLSTVPSACCSPSSAAMVFPGTSTSLAPGIFSAMNRAPLIGQVGSSAA
jgi:hypothetical protein